MAQTRLPHPLLQKGLFIAPGEAGFAGHNRAHGQRAERRCAHIPGGSPGMQRAEINPNDPVFPGDVSQSESAPVRLPFLLSAAQETLCY